MADWPKDRAEASTSGGRKASCKSAKGHKAQQPSKVELRDLERRQKAIERQVSLAAKKQAYLDTQSISSSVSHHPVPHQAVSLPRGLSPEGVGVLSPNMALPVNEDWSTKRFPFACFITAKAPESQPVAEPMDLELSVLPEAVQSLNNHQGHCSWHPGATFGIVSLQSPLRAME